MTYQELMIKLNGWVYQPDDNDKKTYTMNTDHKKSIEREAEEWRDIPGFEGAYQATTDGEVYSLKTNRYLSKIKHDMGYVFISINHAGIKKLYYLHRLVALTFLPNPENKRCVNHIDANKQNNSIGNLEWNTDEENEHHALVNGLKPKGIKNGASKLNPEIVKYIIKTRDETSLSFAKIAELLGVNKTTVRRAYKGINWKQ